jgi:hypothetical protein
MSGKDAATLRALAQQCRSLARGVTTPGAARSLQEMAATYEKQADEAAGREAEAPPARPAVPPAVSEDAD